MKPLIAVDYDGTLTENAWPHHGDWKPGALEALRELVKHARVTIFTVRIAPMELDEITERPVQLVQQEVNTIRQRLDDAGLREVTIWQKNYKPPAILFIDDRAIHFNDRPGAWKAILTKSLIKLKQAPELFPEYKEQDGAK